MKHNVDLIFTYVCAFEVPQEREYLTSLSELFKTNGGEFYFVELSADLSTRLERNETPHRMERKASKRDVAWSKSRIWLLGSLIWLRMKRKKKNIDLVYDIR